MNTALSPARVRYLNYQENLSPEEYSSFSLTYMSEVARILAPNGSFFLNLGTNSKNPYLPHEIVLELKRVGLTLQNEIHWVKSISVQEPDGKRVTVGPFRPVNSPHFITNCHEYIFHSSHQGDVPLGRLAVGIPFKDKSNIDRFPGNNGKDKRCRGNVWFIRYPTNYNRGACTPPSFRWNCRNTASGCTAATWSWWCWIHS